MSHELEDETTYRAPEVCRLAGITYRQLDYWARVGTLKPSIRDTTGSGKKRLYSSADIKKARAIGRLRHLGIRRHLEGDPMSTIQDLIDQLESVREDYKAPLEEIYAAAV
jgi:DNA-binding transcriptional MerR regulator